MPERTPRSWVIRITARSCSLRRRSRSRRIPACTVTSSAVVGSSAISSLGRQASAIAIAMRWRIPPENWCGNRPRAARGSGRRTSSRSSTARASAAARPRPRCKRTWSVSCRPTESIGWSEVNGSWNTIASSRPEIPRRRRRGIASRSSPPKRAVPPTRAPSGRRPRSASMEIVFPLPLSPATPNTSPGCTS